MVELLSALALTLKHYEKEKDTHLWFSSEWEHHYCCSRLRTRPSSV